MIPGIPEFNKKGIEAYVTAKVLAKAKKIAESAIRQGFQFPNIKTANAKKPYPATVLEYSLVIGIT